MQSSYRIFKISGISVELHVTFIIIFFLALSIATLNGLVQYQGIGGLIDGMKVIAIFVLLFGTVLIHEFSHSLVALRNGIRVPRITLTPIGGAANIDVPEDPKLEFKLSLAGPMINFVMLFLALSVLLIAWPDFLLSMDFLNYFNINDSNASYFYLNNVFRDIFMVPNIFAIISVMNFLLGVFNMIPAFPMDGGRILRSLLANWIDYVEATRISVQISRICAILMIILSPFFGLMLILIAFFILITGPSELRMVKIKHALHGMTLGSIAVSGTRYVDEFTTLLEFLRSTAYPGQNHYPVTDQNKRVIGILNIDDLKDIKREDFDKIPARNLATGGVDMIDASLKVEDKIATLLTHEFILVVDSKQVIGYLTPDHLLEIARFYGISKK